MYSIIIPVYNGEKCIKRSIESVLKQTRNDYEIIIVDDGSTDDTVKIVKEIEDKRIKLIESFHKGVSCARNEGIRQSRGEYICFLDADDEYESIHLETIDRIINKYPEVGLYSTISLTRLFGGKTIDPNKGIKKNIMIYERDYFDYILKYGNVINTNCVCARKTLFRKFGVFVEGATCHEDTDMWERIIIHTGIALATVTTNIRNRDYSVATRSSNRRLDTDPFNRKEEFIRDNTIPQSVLISYLRFMEHRKVHVIRTFQMNGNKRRAIQLFRELDYSMIPRSKIMLTLFCFAIPSTILESLFNIKNRGYFQNE